MNKGNLFTIKSVTNFTNWLKTNIEYLLYTLFTLAYIISSNSFLSVSKDTAKEILIVLIGGLFSTLGFIVVFISIIIEKTKNILGDYGVRISLKQKPVLWLLWQFVTLIMITLSALFLIDNFNRSNLTISSISIFLFNISVAYSIILYTFLIKNIIKITHYSANLSSKILKLISPLINKLSVKNLLQYIDGPQISADEWDSNVWKDIFSIYQHALEQKDFALCYQILLKLEKPMIYDIPSEIANSRDRLVYTNITIIFYIESIHNLMEGIDNAKNYIFFDATTQLFVGIIDAMSIEKIPNGELDIKMFTNIASIIMKNKDKLSDITLHDISRYIARD